MTRHYTVTLDSASIRKMIERLELLKSRLQIASENIAKRLADIGYDHATVNFADAEYDGTNDADIQLDPIPNGYRLSANGQSIMFIEFGTGITKGNGYPGTKPPEIAPIGTYGLGQGAKGKWVYNGNPGTNGVVINTKNNAVLTRGNRPNACMFNAGQTMHDAIIQIVKEEMAHAYA